MNFSPNNLLNSAKPGVNKSSLVFLSKRSRTKKNRFELLTDMSNSGKKYKNKKIHEVDDSLFEQFKKEKT